MLYDQSNVDIVLSDFINDSIKNFLLIQKIICI